MGHGGRFVSKMLAKPSAGCGEAGTGLPFVMLLPKANQGYNAAMGPLQKKPPRQRETVGPGLLTPAEVCPMT